MKEQIEEIAKILCGMKNGCDECMWDRVHCNERNDAEEIYNAGYRKLREGEWETIPDYQPNKLIAYRHTCSVCKTSYKDIRPHGHKYCHECGAKMKGGAE